MLHNRAVARRPLPRPNPTGTRSPPDLEY